jgi:hypothetical protein
MLGGVQMKKLILPIALGVLLVLAIGAYFGSPYLAAHNFVEAAQAGDADKLDTYVDFPSVRDGFKAEMNARASAKASSEPGDKDNPLAGIGMMLAPMIIDKVIDTYVTPDGLSAMIKGQKVAPGAHDAASKSNNATYSYEFISLDRFRVKVFQKDSKRPDDFLSVMLERRGIFSWKVIRVSLPESAFDEDSPVATQTAPEASTNPQMDSAAAAPADAPVNPSADNSPGQKQVELPSFSAGESYSSVRTKMANAGWEPFHAPDADQCSEDDKRCVGRPEMESCAGTGKANCKFLWKKSDNVTAICTVGEEDAVFDVVCNYP